MSNNRQYGFASDTRRGEEAEKVPLQQQKPVTLQPSWEDRNLPEDELNFRNLTMEDASLQVHPPQDTRYLVYLTFILHGIGVLMPWNMFITAEPYFAKYKLGPEYLNEEVTYANSYLQYVTFAAQVPNLLFNWVNIFIQIGGNLTTRIVWSISIEVVIFILTVALAMSDTHEWPGTFFWITMISVVILNMANGIYQNTIFGMAAKLPIEYTGAVILGSNISGTFAAVVDILSKTFASNIRLAAIYYFITALFVLLICFDSYFALPLNKYYRHYQLKEKKETAVKNQSDSRNSKVPYFYIFRKAFPQLFNIFFVFFVTLSIFPAVQAKVKVSDPDFWVPSTLYTSVTCFLTFNIAATVGSYLPIFGTWPSPKYLVIPVVARVVFIPLFLLSNYHISDNLNLRMLPILITNDWVYWIIAITMGVSSGYLSSLGMMYAPRTVEEKYASVAGMFGAAALVTGIFTGVLASFIWPALINNVGF